MIIRFLIYGSSGLCLEVFWTGILSFLNGDKCFTAKTYLWMFFIYGSATFMEPIHNYIRFLPLFVRGCIWLVLIWSVEFISGWIIKKIIGKCPWDYSRCGKLQIMGLIRLDFAPLWFIVGVLFEKMHDALLQFFP
jgi:uncharacterized membrane protein